MGGERKENNKGQKLGKNLRNEKRKKSQRMRQLNDLHVGDEEKLLNSYFGIEVKRKLLI